MANDKTTDSGETPQQWRNQLLRELAHIVYEMAAPDAQRRIERIMNNLDATEQRAREIILLRRLLIEARSTRAADIVADGWADRVDAAIGDQPHAE